MAAAVEALRVATVATRTQDQPLLCVMKTAATVATQNQDQTPLCVLKTVVTATTQVTGTLLC